MVGHENSSPELDILERRRLSDGAIEHSLNRHQLNVAPIPGTWILEGSPIARTRLLSGSTDGTTSTYMWDCTAGRFNWFYDIDETICLVEGSVIAKDEAGQVHSLKAGDFFYFPKGSRAEWTVKTYVRKIAFIHVPLPRMLLRIKQVLKAVKRIVRPGSAGNGQTSFRTE